MPRIPIPLDLLFLVGGIKVYHDLVNRDIYEEIKTTIGQEQWQQQRFHFNRISEFLSDPATTKYINWAINEIASVFIPSAGDWILDSTGLETTTRGEHRTMHYGRLENRVRADYVKLHLAIERNLGFCGAAVVTSYKGDDTADTSQLKPLLETLTKNGFAIRSVTADKIYASESNLAAIDQAGAIPYIPLKRMYTPEKMPTTPLMRRLAHRIQSESDFYDNYRLRPFVESWIAALKTKFRSCVRGHTFATQCNEGLYMVLCHDITVLVHAIIEYKMDVDHILSSIVEQARTSE